MSTYAYLLGAIEIDDSNDTIILDENGVDLTATVAHGTYYLWTGTGNIFTAVSAALDAAGANTYEFTKTQPNISPSAVTVAVTLTRASGGLTFRVRWPNVATTFPGEALGFAVEKVAASAADEVSTKSPSCLWVPSDLHRIVMPRAEWVLSEQAVADGDTEVARFSDRARRMRIEYSKINGLRVFQHTNTADPYATLEAFIGGHNDGRSLVVMESDIDSGTLLQIIDSSYAIFGETTHRWKFGQTSGGSLEPEHTRMGLDLWDLDLELLGVVA